MQPSVFSLQCVSRRSRLLVENYRTSCKTHVETYGQRHLSEAFWFWEKISTLFPLWGSCSHFDPTLFPLCSHSCPTLGFLSLCSHFVPILSHFGVLFPLSFICPTFGFLFPLLTTCFRCTSRAMQPSVFSLQCVSRRSRLLVENYRTSCKTHVETYGQRHLSEAFWFWEKISTLFPLWGSCSHFDPTLFPLCSHSCPTLGFLSLCSHFVPILVPLSGSCSHFWQLVLDVLLGQCNLVCLACNAFLGVAVC